MPELPEVEVVCRELTEMIPSGTAIRSWKFFRKDLRFNIPQKKLTGLVGQKIYAVKRRAKYILFDLGEVYIISHLGMTGSWRRSSGGQEQEKHDHLTFGLKNGDFFIFNDPRRFGFIEVVEKKHLVKRFAALGVEPLEKDTDFSALTKKFKTLNAPIKTALMNQKLIVGVGNIYASEILFASRVSPLKKSSKLTEAQYDLVWKNTQSILKKAIEQGGSTIENYKSATGAEGEYQAEFSVYGREKELCRNCHSPIRQKTMAGRSTFWCSDCQK